MDMPKLLSDNTQLKQVVNQAKTDFQTGKGLSPAVMTLLFIALVPVILFIWVTYILLSHQQMQLNRIYSTFSFVQPSTINIAFLFIGLLSVFKLPVLLLKAAFGSSKKNLAIGFAVFVVSLFLLDLGFTKRGYEAGRAPEYLCPGIGNETWRTIPTEIDPLSGRKCMVQTPENAEQYQAIKNGEKPKRVPQEYASDLENLQALTTDGRQKIFRTNEKRFGMYEFWEGPGFDPYNGEPTKKAKQSEIDEKIQILTERGKANRVSIENKPVVVEPHAQIVQPAPIVVAKTPQFAPPLQVRGVPIAENSVVYEKGPNGTIKKTETFNGEVTQSVLYPKKVDKEKPENVTADVNIP